MNKELVLHLKLLKKKRKITNEKLSELSHTPLGTINKLFSGNTEDPKLSTVIAVCKVLDVSVDDIIRGTSADNSAKQISLTEEESRTLTNLRKLDSHSRNLISTIINCELTKQPSAAEKTPMKTSEKDGAKTYNIKIIKDPPIPPTMSISLYEMPLSAAFSSEAPKQTISVPRRPSQRNPDFALRIKGDSMEPDYYSGDIILVKKCSAVEKGQLGVFSINGEAVFRIFGGNKLVAINKDYRDIPLRGQASCIGRAAGKLSES